MESLAVASAVLEHLAQSRAQRRPVGDARQATIASTGAPSIHVRVLLTWISIFPLVTLGMSGMAFLGPITGAWPTWLRALLLTAIVVPTSAYFVVPRLMVLSMKWTRWRMRRRELSA